MSSIRFEGLNFYERTLETIINNINLFEGSELKLLLVLNKLTVGSGLNAVEIKLADLEKLTGLSRKTVIKCITRLKSLSLIKRGKKTKPYRYGINRDQLQKMLLVESDNENLLRNVVSKHKMMEDLYFEEVYLPPESKKIFEIWNKHFHKRLNITSEFHIKCIQIALKTVSIDSLYNIISRHTKVENNKKIFFTDEGIEKTFSNIKGGQK